MKVTRLGQATPLVTSTALGGSGGTLDPVVGGGLVPTASGSNSWSWGSNVSLITANGSNSLIGPFVNFAAGSNITLAVSSNTMTITAGTGDVAGHLDDAIDAHDASAISFTPTGTIAATDVQAAIAEVATEATGSRTFAFFGG